ncbi:unnamed protein product [Chondrus crispus]|uniref:Uncharacterized protein n=1 Tax=Chondrus crispus TaxID=2769 RepID=R7QQW9_CHOCR|nr:unnamed protein product [Chondrus crispus]CDF40153.1 unnamed protein product [Chondrus crispus]|eukprot:XP_005710447.1 unnamed protein product [Chondrus crispus]
MLLPRRRPSVWRRCWKVGIPPRNARRRLLARCRLREPPLRVPRSCPCAPIPWARLSTARSSLSDRPTSPLTYCKSSHDPPPPLFTRQTKNQAGQRLALLHMCFILTSWEQSFDPNLNRAMPSTLWHNMLQYNKPYC